MTFRYVNLSEGGAVCRLRIVLASLAMRELES